MGGPVKVQVGGAWVDGATFVSDGSAFSAGTVYVQIGGAWVPEAGATPPPSTAYADAVLADSPIGYWRLGESSGTTAADASGGGHPGTYNGGNVTLGVTGAVGGNTAITSNGSVTGPPVTIATYASTPTTLTIEGWVRLNVTPPARHQCLMSISLDATTRIMAEARRNATGNRVALWDNVNSWRESTAAALTTGVWHHLAYVINGSVVTFYIDGAAAGSVTTGAVPTTPTSPIIGSGLGGVDLLLGDIDEVALYNTALSAGRIAAHFAAA
jgi:hypothetical protein